ncbi:MAG: SRPBCC domain-containing protein, partial [Patulibacter sp.]|nr:SRPBCC domain-containing protein [Patulibacter sp.]
PDGFEVTVSELDLRPGGTLVYAMEATGPGQIAFMESAGMPLVTVSRKTFTEVDEPTRLAYRSLVDFVPGVNPYEVLTVVDITPTDQGCEVVMYAEPMHDDVWTERLLMGRENELDNLAAALAG